MDILTTNQLPIDSNKDIPRVIKKGSTSITTSTIPGSGWVEGTATVTLSEINSLGNNDITIVVLDNQTNLTYFSPVQTTTFDNNFVLIINHYLTGISNKLTLNLQIDKKGGATTDTYTVYYIVYSTSIDSAISL